MIAELTIKVQDVIKERGLIELSETVLVAVSGGPDSVCLLHLLHSVGIKVFAFHLNHMLRGQEAQNDQEYVEKLCDSMGVTLFVKSIDVKEFAKANKFSLEEAGRKVRYHELEIYAKEINATKIAVGHNKNDQAETFIMNIIRGSGLSGLTGMKYKSGNIIRPLLDIERQEIEQYCSDFKLYPRIDSSNQEDQFTRNKMRLKLIPYINELFHADITKSIYKTISHLRGDEEIIESSVKEHYEECLLGTENREVCLDVKKLKACDDSMLKRVIRSAINSAKHDLHDIGTVHVEQVVRLTRKGQSGRHLRLPGEIIVVKHHDTLKIYKETGKREKPKFEKPLIIPGKTQLLDISCEIDALVEKRTEVQKEKNNSKTQYFDYEKVKGKPLVVRNRREGDIINLGGTKKLKKYFIDAKISESIRDYIPLVAEGNEVIWAIGYRVSDSYKLIETSAGALKLICKWY